MLPGISITHEYKLYNFRILRFHISFCLNIKFSFRNVDLPVLHPSTPHTPVPHLTHLQRNGCFALSKISDILISSFGKRSSNHRFQHWKGWKRLKSIFRCKSCLRIVLPLPVICPENSRNQKYEKAQKLITCNHSGDCPPTGCSGGFLQCSQPLHWPHHLMDWNMFKKVKVKRKLIWETLIQRRILRDLLVLQSSSLCPHTGICSPLWWKGLHTKIYFKCRMLTCKFQTMNLFGTSFVSGLPRSHYFLF